jgi:hypothetical protein
MKGFVIVIVIILVVIFLPFLGLWCVETIWDVPNMEYDFWHWLAALCIGGSLFGAGQSSK